jgi:putative superfamily III holin-X
MEERSRKGEPAETPPAGWSQRLQRVLEAARRLLATRAAILREEMGAKGEALARAAAGCALAAALGMLSLLLLTAWIAAVFSRLLGGPILGILATFVLYLAVAAAAAVYGSKALGRVKPFEFPVTTGEIRKDWETVRSSAMREPTPPPPGQTKAEVPAPVEPPMDDLEARFRAGSE